MNRTFLSVAVATQLFAGAAFGQTGSTTTYGGDWSGSLGTAMLNVDGTSARPASEISTQWAILAEEDREMIRRDCMAHEQDPADGATQGQAGATDGMTGTAPDAATQPAGTTDATGATGMTGATGGTEAADATGTAGAIGGTGAMDAPGTTAGTATEAISVSSEQMDEICAAISDL